MTNAAPRIAITDADIESCFDVMAELRTALVREEFLETVRQLEREGYRLAYLADAGQIVAVAGYRIAHNLFLGKYLYVDDLVTCATTRSQGYGDTLYNWLKEEARAADCQYIHLDSGVQRGDTHRFYFRQGLTISSFHFREKLVARD